MVCRPNLNITTKQLIRIVFKQTLPKYLDAVAHRLLNYSRAILDYIEAYNSHIGKYQKNTRYTFQYFKLIFGYIITNGVAFWGGNTEARIILLQNEMVGECAEDIVSHTASLFLKS